MTKKYFYITTTLPYVNAEPHIGFALEIIAADVIARYHRSLDHNVVFNTGTDEHGQKIYQKAQETGKDVQAYVDEYAAKFNDLQKLLHLRYTHFIRTTDAYHKEAAQAFWKRCEKNGYIYKGQYKAKYCVGCELEKQDSELVDEKCPLHPNRELETRNEENYFFKFSAFQDKLLDYYEKHPHFVQPEGKFKEIQSFVSQGLKDFSISRLQEKMPWGIEVPDDPDHVMYVWFDALVNYISTLGWPNDQENFQKYWGTQGNENAIQIAGKDNLRQQSAMWQAMLMAAGLPNSQKILINGFISINGQKMSKSLGNVISPKEMVERYGTDATRFLLMFLGPIGNDMDTSWKQLNEMYTAYLVNGLGNVCSRVAALAQKINMAGITAKKELDSNFKAHMNSYNIYEALRWLVSEIQAIDTFLSENEPWKKQGTEQFQLVQSAIEKKERVAAHLQPFMPETTQYILNHFSQDHIKRIEPLFPKIEE